MPIRYPGGQTVFEFTRGIYAFFTYNVESGKPGQVN